jgi:tRNA threonylcarbamoyladenosine biosynthesis protein TsaB
MGAMNPATDRPRILALETSGGRCGAALLVGSTLREREVVAPRGHAELLLPMVEQLLAEAGLALGDCDAIAFGRGPGSFTGVRIATSVAQGLAYGAALPLVPVSGLAALARGAWRRGGATRVYATLDARMDEVYLAAYELSATGDPRAVVEEQLVPPSHAPQVEGSGWAGIGTGFGVHGAALAARLGAAITRTEPGAEPSAADIAALGALAFAQGETVPPRDAAPVYLRDKVAFQRSN